MKEPNRISVFLFFGHDPSSWLMRVSYERTELHIGFFILRAWALILAHAEGPGRDPSRSFMQGFQRAVAICSFFLFFSGADCNMRNEVEWQKALLGAKEAQAIF